MARPATHRRCFGLVLRPRHATQRPTCLVKSNLGWLITYAEENRLNRKVVRKTTLTEQEDSGIILDATPSQRMGMVWQLTLDAWTLMDPAGAKSEFQRHVGRIERRGS